MSRTTESRKPITPSQLRADVYRLLDEVLDTGRPLEIERHGRRLQIIAVDGSKLDRIQVIPDLINGDPDELVHIDWSVYWNPDDAVTEPADPP